MEPVTVLGIVFPVVGVGLLLMACRQFLRARAFLRSSIATSGTVVGEIRQPDESRVYHFPRVSFRTRDGREMVFQSEVGTSTPGRVGRTLPVRYLPDRPEKAEVDTFAARWLPTIVFSVLGDAFLMVAVGLWAGWIRT